MRLLTLLAALFPILLAAVEWKAPAKPIDPEGAYVMLDLAGRANDHAPLAVSESLVEVGRIPFRLLNGERNHLFLKPIGWSAEFDESKEYPGYMAKYDDFPAEDDSTRAAFRIPVSDYQAVWLLAATDDDPGLTEKITLRFGRFGKNARVSYADFTGVVPRAGTTKVRPGEGNVVQVLPTEQGNLYLVRIPVTRVFAQDFRDYWEMHLDVTKELGVAVNLPDPYRYQLRPLGDPSGVRIYAMTLERPSLQMEVESREPGNVFNQPQKPTFDITFRNHFLHYQIHHLEVVTRRDDGEERTFTFDEFRPWHPRHRAPTSFETVELDLTKRGHYQVAFNLYQNKKLILQRLTTMAVLAPDSRRYRHESPFGVWDFNGTHTTPSDPDLTGSLAKKAGWRYAAKNDEYGVESCFDPHLHNKGMEKLMERKEEPGFVAPERALMFHETSVSGPHVTRTPDVFSGGNYALSEADQQRFDTLREEAIATMTKAREHFPNMEIYVGNGPPHLVEELCRQGFPKELMRVAGNESGSFMRPPEAQPTDFVANNAGIFMFRRILDHYGYNETKLYQCFEITYPNTNPGNLEEATQAEYFVRHLMHSLSWGMPKLIVGALTDMRNSYYHSNWGASGFCHGYPNVSPKLSYVAYAVLTQVLDGATFRRAIETGSPVVYALEFARKDGAVVTALWTTRGERPAALEFPMFSRAGITSLYGREEALSITRGKAEVTLSETPLYLVSNRPIGRLSLGESIHADQPEEDAFLIDKLDSLAGWSQETERSIELETYNFMELRRQGEFSWREVAQADGREAVFGVSAKPIGGSEYLPMYSVLRRNEPVEIPGRPTEIGLWVRGNGGWGRIIFELVDGSGQRWISIGSEMGGEPNPWMADWMPKEKFEELQASGSAGISDWNSNDAWGRSRINFEGWRFVRFPLPGNYGATADGYHWPRTSQWRFGKEPRVTYPLTFTKLVVTLPEKVLYLDQWAPVANPEIYLSELQVTYRPVESTIATE